MRTDPFDMDDVPSMSPLNYCQRSFDDVVEYDDRVTWNFDGQHVAS